MNSPYAAKLLHALRFASEKHRDHRRKGITAAPYINHPIAVAEQIAAVGLGEDIELLMAAVLHDVVEDTETTDAEMLAEFGARVTAIVLEVSDDKSLHWEQRKVVTIENISKKSDAAKVLKLSDLIANIHDVIHHPPDWTTERKLRYLDWGERVAQQISGTHTELESRLKALLREGREQISAQFPALH